MHIPSSQFTRFRSSLCILACLVAALATTGCGGGADDPATLSALEDLGVLIVPNTDGQVSTLNALPSDPAKLTEAIELTKKLNSLKTVTAMEGIPITDDHLGVIGSNRNLVQLNVNKAPVTDAGVAKLTGCSNLESLALVGTGVTSESMASFAKMPKLNLLNINDTKIDGGFANLQACKNLQWILIGGLKISDAEAEAISKIPAISHVTYSDTTEISEQGLKTLKSARDCNVDLVANQPATAAP